MWTFLVVSFSFSLQLGHFHTEYQKSAYAFDTVIHQFLDSWHSVTICLFSSLGHQIYLKNHHKDFFKYFYQ